MVCVLSVPDEVDDALAADPGAARSAGVILAGGELPFGYLLHHRHAR